MLPREHGSWAMLFAPPLAGWAAAGGGPAGAGVFLALALTGAFLARTPLAALVMAPSDARAWRWLAVYSAGALLGAAGLCLASERWDILLLGLPAGAALAATLWYSARRKAMTEANELVGIAGLSLGAPAAHYAAAGAWAPEAFWLWLLCVLFFAGPVYHVKMLVTRRIALAPGAPAASRANAHRARTQSLAYHSGAFAAVAAAAWLGVVSAVAVVPFLLSLGKTAWWARFQGARLELKRIGWQEVVWTCVFVAVLASCGWPGQT